MVDFSSEYKSPKKKKSSVRMSSTGGRERTRTTDTRTLWEGETSRIIGKAFYIHKPILNTVINMQPNMNSPYEAVERSGSIRKVVIDNPYFTRNKVASYQSERLKDFPYEILW